VLVALLLVALVSVGFWQFQVYTNHQHDLSVAATATGVAKANARATVNAGVTATAQVHAQATSFAQAIGTAYAGSPTPSAGAKTPPAVTGTTVKTSDGLQYIDIKTGSGTAAKAGDDAFVEYTGWVQSTGKEFDSSFDHGGSAFEVKPLGQAQIIPGFQEGIVGMKTGGTRRLIIPASLGYGSQANGPIPANATLIFDITLVYIH
jgi:FKBP-type peptidyl-prolyl cis-trans isomerase